MFILKIKKAMKDEGFYEGPINLNWEKSEETSWYNFCRERGGNFTPTPSYYSQSKKFIEHIDSIDITEYNEPTVESKGFDVRQLIPERQPINKEGLSKDVISRVDGMVNENVIKPADSFLEEKPKPRVVTPQEVVALEKLYNREPEPVKETVVKTSKVDTIRTR